MIFREVFKKSCVFHYQDMLARIGQCALEKFKFEHICLCLLSIQVQRITSRSEDLQNILHSHSKFVFHFVPCIIFVH